MPIEDRDEYIDRVAQAVIDRIEERDRTMGLVEMVARRVMELQQAKANAEAVLAAEALPHSLDHANGHAAPTEKPNVDTRSISVSPN